MLSVRGGDPEDAAATDPVLGTPDEPVSVAAAADAFRGALERRRKDELDRGLTLVGPHRDDVLFQLNGLPARGYASHGESWSFALAIKLAGPRCSARSRPWATRSSSSTTCSPSSTSHGVNGSGGGRDYEQVLITAAVFGDVPDQLAAHTVRIEAGTIVTDEAHA